MSKKPAKSHPTPRTKPLDWTQSEANRRKRAAQGLPLDGGPRERKPNASTPVAAPADSGDAPAE